MDLEEGMDHRLVTSCRSLRRIVCLIVGLRTTGTLITLSLLVARSICVRRGIGQLERLRAHAPDALTLIMSRLQHGIRLAPARFNLKPELALGVFVHNVIWKRQLETRRRFVREPMPCLVGYHACLPKLLALGSSTTYPPRTGHRQLFANLRFPIFRPGWHRSTARGGRSGGSRARSSQCADAVALPERCPRC